MLRCMAPNSFGDMIGNSAGANRDENDLPLPSKAENSNLFEILHDGDCFFDLIVTELRAESRHLALAVVNDFCDVVY